MPSVLAGDRINIGSLYYIELPPTRLDVVVETLLRSQKVASECGETYATVTYDLAIAKPALQIQAQESPRFDNVFVCLGAFHICMAISVRWVILLSILVVRMFFAQQKS